MRISDWSSDVCSSDLIARQFWRFEMKGIACKSDNPEQPGQSLGGALLRPVQRRALWIGVDELDALAFARPLPGDMEGQRGLADAAFLIEERDDHATRPDSVAWRSRS